MKKVWKLMAVTLTIAMFVTGCGSSSTTTSTTTTTTSGGGSSTTATETTEAAEKVMRSASDTSISTLNVHQATASTDSESTINIAGVFYRMDVDDDDLLTETVKFEFAAGEPVDVNGDGLVWNITLKPDMVWENGDTLDANDFIYSYKMILDPILLNPQAGRLYSNYVTIENAAAYYTQASGEEEVAWEDVGIKMLDDLTIQITLTDPANVIAVERHFSTTSCSPVYEPYYEEYMNTDRTSTQYGVSADKIISCGPFTIESWTKGAEIVYVKNESYVDSDLVYLDRMVRKVVEDSSTKIQMFENGELDYVGLSTDGIEMYGQDPRLVIINSRTIRWIDINKTNPEQPILNNLNFRLAMYYATDRETLASLTYTNPAQYFVAHTSVAYADGTIFRDVEGADDYLPENYGYNPELAKEYFDKALAEEGLTSVSLQLNYSESVSSTKLMSEYIQKEWSEIFGADKFSLTLQSLPSAQHLDTMKTYTTDPDSYELAWTGWTWSAGDYSPNRTFEVITSDYSRRNAPYDNLDLDALYYESIDPDVKLDEVKVAELTMEMEQIAIENVLAVPVVESVTYYLISENLEFPVGNDIKLIRYYTGAFGNFYD